MKKKLLLLGMAMALTLVWMTPIQSEAVVCEGWTVLEDTLNTYCATPVCHRSIPTQFVEFTRERTCYDDVSFSSVIERQIAKVDYGCCLNP